MRKIKYWLVLLALITPVIILSGCESVTQRADTQDTWNRIERRKRVVIGLDDSFVPMGFRQKNGKLVGYDVDLARAVFKQYGIKADFQPIDWSMKETELKNGTIDLLWNGYSINPSRRKKVAFSRPYLKNEQILVTKKASNILNFADMKGKSLGVQNGSTGLTALDERPKVLKDLIKNQKPVLYDTFPDAFIDLNANRIQGILMDQVYADYYIKHQKNSASYRTYSSKELPVEYYAVGMRKGDKTLRHKINAGLGKLQKNGELRKINQKWFGTNSNYLGAD
ncbi:amino acid ABC transporter substrate-binding protein [Limosilactobacillus urinaemulieris]|uniref:Amino acid ABC transporter substrate-binding protein n=1 Tax=Limosilactobacillus urinaemulieris TaxID=2742600 RepID=A0ABR8ZM62_9LACO|nr:amino acid ABC transporter substrate-binding protein [Limosilactobacillus urinaemulieris]MBD8085990.1 amino acid ABC transporter substrate-binding protein [Limosilactobacillus urinaemulieris]MCR5524532.1 amino acid ABC transporter substrate-binding protein [Lactobacillus sp.]